MTAPRRREALGKVAGRERHVPLLSAGREAQRAGGGGPGIMVNSLPTPSVSWEMMSPSAGLGVFTSGRASSSRAITGGIRVGTGMPIITNSLCSQTGAAFNMPFGTKTTYDSQGNAPNTAFGKNWVSHDLGQLIYDGSNVMYMEGANQIEYFVSTGGGAFQSTFFVKSVLSQNTGTGVFTLISPDGSVKTFTSGGLLSGFSDAYGNQGTVSYITVVGQARVNLVQITSGADSIKYDYDWDNATAPLTVLTYYVNNRAVQKTEQTYYTGGNLRKVVISHNTAATGPTWEEVESRYYTYLDEDAAGDNKGLLKHVLGPNAYKQMHDASPGGQNWPDTATSDTDFDQYADSKFAQYDGPGRVEHLYRHGGQYFYQFAYSASGFSGSNLNTWIRKVVATQPDGSEERLYYNLAGQLMLRQVVENPGGSEKVWNVLHQRFDNTTGRRVLAAGADAIDNVDENDAFLVTLHPNLGLIRIYHFDANGNHDLEAIQQGTSDTERKLWSRTFVRNTASGLPAANVYEVASETVYRNDNNTGGITTNYSFQWHTNGVTPTYQVLKRTTTLPAVPVGENGRNQTHTLVADYNQWALLTSDTDESGVKTTYQWDLARGAIKQMVRDQGAGKLNLTTDYVLDDFGRVVIEKGPIHPISLNGTPTEIRRTQWTYYKDVDDQQWTFGGYITIVSGVENAVQAVGPVTLQYHYQTPADTTNMKGWRQESVVQAEFTSSGIPSASATFARSSWTRWSARFFNRGGEEKVNRLYWLVPGSGDGTADTHYGQTEFAYDSGGDLHRIKQPGGTICKTTYNAMGWPLEKSVGTDDGSPGNMKVLAVQEYDNGGEGVGNLTKTTVKVDDAPGNNRIVEYTADWRQRLLETKASVEKDGGGTWVILERNAYDNRDNLVSVTTYHTSVVNSNRIGYRTHGWDTRNRHYMTRYYSVNLSNGTPGTSLDEKIYYDPTGNVARQIRPGGDAFDVRHYNAVSRVTASYVGYDSSSSSGGVGPDPSNISTSTIIEQHVFAYDNGGNVISITRKQRFDNATGVGALNSTTIQPKARASHIAYYPDALGRSQAVANFGTYAANAWDRNSFPTVPSRSDTVLVNSTTYDAAGDPIITIDPQNVQTCRTFDKAGRLTSIVENCAASSGSSSSSSGSTPDYRVTRMQYTPDSLPSKLTLDNSATGQEVTEWSYGVLPSGAKPSTLASNRLVREKAFADSGGSTDRVFYQYNRLGELTVLTDQAATAHAYVLDKFGRLLSDTATLAGGSPLDNTVGKLDYGYEVRGHRSRATSYAPGGSTKINEVTWEFNSFGQPSKEIQNITPSVGGSSREFVYGYEAGTNNSARRTSMTLPSGQVINYIYSGHDAFLSRVTQVRHASTTIASYRYLGLGVFVGVNDNVPAVALTYEHGSSGDAGDQYTGLDRFGRVVDLRWNKSTTALVSLQMGYSRASNVVWWRDNAAIAHTPVSVTNENQAFVYDNLYQLKQRRRGAMSGTSIPSPVQTETIGYDQVGNWLTYQTQTPSLSQTRTHNKGNEITAITNPAGVITPPTYDPTGNMTYLPQPANWNAAYSLKWDAWNRLMKATPTAGAVQDYAYDALSRRVTKTISSTIRKFYYTDSWQVAEEYIGTASDPQRRYFWGARDINDLIRRQRYSSGTTLQDDLYALRDASLNVISLTDASGSVQQRARYAAFGKAEFLTSAWVVASNTYDWNVLFHGHYFDGETGFGQMRYRYYHPTLGRWLTRDPLNEKGGVNLYTAVRNDFINKRDGLGLEENSIAAPSCTDPKKDNGNTRTSYETKTTDGLSPDQKAVADKVIKETLKRILPGGPGAAIGQASPALQKFLEEHTATLGARVAFWGRCVTEKCVCCRSARSFFRMKCAWQRQEPLPNWEMIGGQVFGLAMEGKGPNDPLQEAINTLNENRQACDEQRWPARE